MRPIPISNLDHVKLVVFDIDGTLLEPNERKVREEIVKRWNTLSAFVQLTVATSRNYWSTKAVLEQMNLNQPLICSEGRTIVEPGGKVWGGTRGRIDRSLAEMLVALFRDEFGIVLEDSYNVYCTSRRTQIQYLNMFRVSPNVIKPLPAVLEFDPVAMLLIPETEEVSSAMDMVRRLLPGTLSIRKRTLSDWYQIENPAVSKAEALQQLCEFLNIQLADVIAVGDGVNDKEMLQLVGCGIAVQHADQICKKVANHSLLVGLECFLEQMIDISCS